MANTATVSFKLPPEYYTVVKAMAAAESRSVSTFLRELVEEVLELDREMERLAALYAERGGRHD